MDHLVTRRSYVLFYWKIKLYSL